jgi:hypothetical protein
MAHPTGESESDIVRLDFDRRLMLQFHGSVVTSDAGLLAYRELDDALRLTAMAGELLADVRTGKNGRHDFIGMLRQAVFGRQSTPHICLAGRPEKRKYSRRFGVHLGNPGGGTHAEGSISFSRRFNDFFLGRLGVRTTCSRRLQTC